KQNSRTFSFDVGPLSDSVLFRIQAGARSEAGGNKFTISLNGNQMGTYNLGSIVTGNEENAAVRMTAHFQRPVNGNIAEVKLDFSPGTSTARGYLDFIEVHSRKPLSLSGGFISFRDWKSVGAGN